MQLTFKGKASIRFKSGAYTLVREHFKPNRNAAIERKMRFSGDFSYIPANNLLKKSTNGQISPPRIDTSVVRPMMIRPIRIKGP